MSKGVIGESGGDRATDKMDKWISRSNGKTNSPLTLVEQFKKSYPDTWKEELQRARVECGITKNNENHEKWTR